MSVTQTDETELCIISTNLQVNKETGQKTTSSVYHSFEDTCSNAPKKESVHYGEMPVKYAKMAGKRPCKGCKLVRIRRERLIVAKDTANQILAGGWKRVSEHLPEGFEVRILVHGIQKTPITIWTSKEDSDEETKEDGAN